MRLRIILKNAVKTLSRNKIRTILTLLGIIIGIGALVAMLSIANGARKDILERVKSYGNNVIFVWSGSKKQKGIKGSFGSTNYLKIPDVEAIQKNCPHVKYATPQVWSWGKVVYRERSIDLNFVGGNEHILYVENREIDRGRPIVDEDIKSAAKVCVLTQEAVKQLFNSAQDPIGAVIRFKKINFTVIGTLKNKRKPGEEEDDDFIYLPFTTVLQRIWKSPSNNVYSAKVSAVSFDDIPKAMEEITNLIRERHNTKEGEENDFEIRGQNEWVDKINKDTKNLAMLLGTIASISLLVGGIGIMNIMLVSVAERTREIGIRVALGAKKKDILSQFATEALLLSLIGGIIGIGVGTATSKIVGNFTKWPIFVSHDSLLLGMFFALLIGVTFGFYPAWRASLLDPIQALRHE
jgi:putative ABC transport system permease protein